MAESKKCSKCGAELPPDAPHGQCLKCLLQLGLDLPHGPATEQEETSPSEKSGLRIGHYKLLKQIGEGGCGVVYMAEQEEPVRRQVALKVIKLGMDTRSFIARFEAERQALAMMDHPNIAKVFDAGATDTGRPYFVMELVHGTRITDFCDERKLSTRARLELFIQICQAIQHAHQKGVIHRDLKPSNVLVTELEGAAFPKIIDFGIAKATGERLTEKTIFTAFERFIGTPIYMSPEQAGLGGLDVDTRSDVYSLGVLLYELLTGRTPFDVQDLSHAAIDEVLKTIREQEPQRPSTKLTTLAASERTIIAQLRQSDPGRLPKLLRGELDWIAMKALEKDRARRYDTATALARDVQRYLNDEPVVARPPGNLYRLQKLVRRNRLTFAAGGAVVLALLGGLGTASWMLVREHEALRLAEAEREQRAAEAAKSRQVSEFLENMLNGVEPSVALGRDTVMLREILDKTTAHLEVELKDQPAVEFELLYTLGGVYCKLGDYEKAQTLLNRALTIQRARGGSENTNVIPTLNLLAFNYFKPGKLDDAEIIYREALRLEMKASDSDSPIAANTLDGLANVLTYQNKPADAEAMHRQALAIYRKRLGNEDRIVAITLFNLSLAVRHQGRVPEAEALCREALAIQQKIYGGAHPEIADTMNMLAIYLRIERKWPEAEAIDRELLPMQRKLFGNRHLCVTDTLARMADEFLNQNRLDEAEACDREAASIFHDAQGKDNPDMIPLLTHLSRIRMKRGDLVQAESLLRQAVSCDNESHPASPMPLAAAMLELAQYRRATNDLAEADALMAGVVDIYEKFPESEPSINLLNGVALLAIERQKIGDTTLLKKYLDFLHKTIGGSHRFSGGSRFEFSTSMDQLTKLLADAGQLAEAECVARDALAVQASEADNEYKLRHFVARRFSLGDILVQESKFAEAERTFAEARTVEEQDPRSENGTRLGLYRRLSNLYKMWGKPDKAAEWQQKRDELKTVQATANSAPPAGGNSPATATNSVSTLR